MLSSGSLSRRSDLMLSVSASFSAPVGGKMAAVAPGQSCVP